MDWELISRASGILTIISFIFNIVSVIIGGFILKKFRYQKEDYKKQRKELYTNLEALRQSIWNDQLSTDRICDKLQTELYKFRVKYWLVSSIFCHYHLFRCIHLLKKDNFYSYRREICNHINYLLARLTMKE